MSVRLGVSSKVLASVLKSNAKQSTFKIHGSVFSIRPTSGSKSNLTRLQLTANVVPTFFRRAYSTSNAETLTLTVEDGPVATFKVAVPLPTDGKTLFSFKGDQNVKQFLHSLKEEDPTVQSSSLHTEDGVKVSNTAQLSDILRSNIKLTINNQSYTLTPVAGNATSVAAYAGAGVPSNIDLNKLDQIQEQRREQKFNELVKDFLPLYLEKQKHDNRATRISNFIMWGGLGYLAAQWAVLARLTWWEFNWDIMEPVTYFITFGTAVLGYAYFAVTKSEYTFNDLRDRIRDKRMVNSYVKNGLDVEKYFVLEHKLKSIDPHALARVEVLAEEAEANGEQQQAAKQN